MTGPFDELDMRIRQLEAERLRPVPPTPIMRRLPQSETEKRSQRHDAGRVDDLEEHLAEIARRRALLEEIGDEEEVPAASPDAPISPPVRTQIAGR